MNIAFFYVLEFVFMILLILQIIVLFVWAKEIGTRLDIIVHRLNEMARKIK